ncbi:MAG: protocatechuate 3,4-dioxygenase subunit alpha [Tepidiformaceae bacterium]
MDAPPTPSQTIGPFFAVLLPLGGNQLIAPGSPGAIVIEGRVFDGAGDPVADAVVETWQAGPDGHYAHPEDPGHDGIGPGGDFTGFGRCHTDAEGRFSFVTLKPGVVPGWDERNQAPHINLSVFARGMLRRLTTRIYFPDERHANERDPVLASIDDAGRRELLVAQPAGPGRLTFDIRLQGEKETPFFAV